MKACVVSRHFTIQCISNLTVNMIFFFHIVAVHCARRFSCKALRYLLERPHFIYSQGRGRSERGEEEKKAKEEERDEEDKREKKEDKEEEKEEEHKEERKEVKEVNGEEENKEERKGDKGGVGKEDATVIKHFTSY